MIVDLNRVIPAILERSSSVLQHALDRRSAPLARDYFWVESGRQLRSEVVRELLSTETLQRGTWQALDVAWSPLHATHELMGVKIGMKVPTTRHDLALKLNPDLPWAEDHFQERVSGVPMNPAPSEAWWPYAVRGNDDHKEAGVFDHTYPERYWPKWSDTGVKSVGYIHRAGVRFPYGDLEDVVDTLVKNPWTRQAYLPVWFPEDTWAAANGKRVPCSLGYQFLLTADHTLDVHYGIRSCDAFRHLTNDIYFTARLLQWVVEQVTQDYPHQDAPHEVYPGKVIMNIGNLHLFAGDVDKVTPWLY